MSWQATEYDRYLRSQDRMEEYTAIDRKSALVVEFDAALSEFEDAAIDAASPRRDREDVIVRTDTRARLLALYRQALDA